MALILAEARVKLLARDAAAAAARFGAYVTPVAGDASDACVALWLLCTRSLHVSYDPHPRCALRSAAVAKALRGVGRVIITGAPGALPAAVAATAGGVTHVVLLSAAPRGAGRTGLAALLPGGDAARSAPAREAAAAACGAPLTVVRAGELRSAPGGRDRLLLSAAGGLAGGISAEDAAAVCVAAALAPPPRRSRTFEVVAAAADGAAVPAGAAPLPPPGGDAWLDALAALPQA
jgi:hypothetical protein